jgi:hypothetical protein
MGLVSRDGVIMPGDEDETYITRLWAIIALWTTGVVTAGIVLALFAL